MSVLVGEEGCAEDQRRGEHEAAAEARDEKCHVGGCWRGIERVVVVVVVVLKVRGEALFEVAVLDCLCREGRL